GSNITLTPDQATNQKESERQLSDINRVDRASRAYHRRKLQCEVSGTAPQIYRRAALPQIERADDIGRTLPLVALRFDSRQLLQGSNTLVPNNRETKAEENSQKN